MSVSPCNMKDLHGYTDTELAFYNKVKGYFDLDENVTNGRKLDELDVFMGIVFETLYDSPQSISEIPKEISKLFRDRPSDLIREWESFLLEYYPAEAKKVLQDEEEREKQYRRAIEVQRIGRCRLLEIPRELRDKIWMEIISGNVIHIFQVSHNEASPRYIYTLCQAPNRLQSSACPPGVGDHANCSASKPSPFQALSLACKQIRYELPKLALWSSNAFQFADLELAEKFLFGLEEWKREAITHLKLAIQFKTTENNTSMPQSMLDAWTSISNYFSNPWDRQSLHMYPHSTDSPDDIKRRIRFYYSDCYYGHNAHRLYKRWQVGRGNTGWDIGISTLRYKGEPRLDIATNWPIYEGYETVENLEEELSAPWRWVHPLSHFRDYSGLKFELYNDEGVISNAAFNQWIEQVQLRMKAPIGPFKCVYFG